MVIMDEVLFWYMMDDVPLKGKIIADIGCGTGRHWQRLYAGRPAGLIGFDVSPRMIHQLRKKYPDADTRLLQGNALTGLGNGSCDLIISTLALAHMDQLETVLEEWCRVLKPGGHIIITDYHPAALQKGGDITFNHRNRTIAVKHNTYSLEYIRQLAKGLGLEQKAFRERIIDDSVKEFYEIQDALPTFNKFKGTPIIYGIHFQKKQ